MTTLNVWQLQAAAGMKDWYRAAVSDDGEKVVVTVGTSIYTSADGGGTWNERTSAGSRGWFQVAMSADGNKIAATVSGGYIYTSADGGATWTERTSAGSRAWRGVAMSADGTKLAAAVYNGYIYTSADSGATWVERTHAGAFEWNGAMGMSADGTKIVAAAGNNYGGPIRRSTNSGALWGGDRFCRQRALVRRRCLKRGWYDIADRRVLHTAAHEQGRWGDVGCRAWAQWE